MFQSAEEDAPKDKRRKSFIPILNLMSPRSPASNTPSFSPRDSQKNSVKITLTEALQKEKLPVGSEIIISTMEELNLFTSLNIFRSKSKLQPVQSLKVQESSFQRRVSVRNIEKKPQKMNTTPEPPLDTYGIMVVAKDEFSIDLETPVNKLGRNESFVQTFDFDDDLKDLLDDQKEIPNNNFSDLKFSVPQKPNQETPKPPSMYNIVPPISNSPLQLAGSESYIQHQLKKKELQEEQTKKITNDICSKIKDELSQQFNTMKEEREAEFRRITTQFQYMNDFLSRAEINLEKGEDFEIYKQKSEREINQLKQDLVNFKNENAKIKKENQELINSQQEKDDKIKSLQEQVELLMSQNETLSQNLKTKETEVDNIKAQKKEITQSFKKLIKETKSNPEKEKKEESGNPAIKQILERISRNDSTLKDVVLQKSKLDDADVSKIAVALVKNTHVKILDLTSNLMTGSCMDDIERLLLNNKTLEELILDECPIENSRVKQLIGVLKKNTTLTQVKKTNSELFQCTAGKFETENDIEKIEEIMDRNYENKMKT